MQREGDQENKAAAGNTKRRVEPENIAAAANTKMNWNNLYRENRGTRRQNSSRRENKEKRGTSR